MRHLRRRRAATATATCRRRCLPCRYYESRVAALKTWEAEGITPYPHKFHVTHSLPAFVAAFSDVTVNGEVLAGPTVSVAGRIMSTRTASGKLQFYDLHGEGAKIQVMFNAAAVDDKVGGWVGD